MVEAFYFWKDFITVLLVITIGNVLYSFSRSQNEGYSLNLKSFFANKDWPSCVDYKSMTTLL